MAKGYDTHQQRQQALSFLGKDLARRSKSRCELSGASGVPLRIYEIPPAPAEPDIDHCLMLCDEVIDQLNHPKSIQPDSWRILGELIWSELPAQQAMAYRLLLHLSTKAPWAASILEDAYLDDTIIEWAKKNPIN